VDKKYNRREAIKRVSVVIGGTTVAIALPSTWTKPVMDAVVGPAAAHFVSYCTPDGARHTAHGTFPNSWWCPQPTTTPD
jgi:hypothetical protein